MVIQDEINLASTSTDGYSRQFQIPNQMSNEDYNITLVAGMIYVTSLDGKNAIALPVQNVTGNILRGNNLIRKINGQVFINQ